MSNLVNIATGKELTVSNSVTNDQRKAYDDLSEWINKPFDTKDYKRALIGPAGTGKTFLVKALISNCKISYSRIGLAAPTHKAARVLKTSIGNISCTVNTLQSDLGLRLNLQSDNFDINKRLNEEEKRFFEEFMYNSDESTINAFLCICINSKNIF